MLSLHGSVKGIGKGDLLENDFRMKFNKIYHCANVQKDKKSSTADQYRKSVKNILKKIYPIFWKTYDLQQKLMQSHEQTAHVRMRHGENHFMHEANADWQRVSNLHWLLGCLHLLCFEMSLSLTALAHCENLVKKLFDELCKCHELNLSMLNQSKSHAWNFKDLMLLIPDNSSQFFLSNSFAHGVRDFFVFHEWSKHDEIFKFLCALSSCFKFKWEHDYFIGFPHLTPHSFQLSLLPACPWFSAAWASAHADFFNNADGLVSSCFIWSEHIRAINIHKQHLCFTRLHSLLQARPT